MIDYYKMNYELDRSFLLSSELYQNKREHFLGALGGWLNGLKEPGGCFCVGSVTNHFGGEVLERSESFSWNSVESDLRQSKRFL